MCRCCQYIHEVCLRKETPRNPREATPPNFQIFQTSSAKHRIEATSTPGHSCRNGTTFLLFDRLCPWKVKRIASSVRFRKVICFGRDQPARARYYQPANINSSGSLYPEGLPASSPRTNWGYLMSVNGRCRLATILFNCREKPAPLALWPSLFSFCSRRVYRARELRRMSDNSDDRRKDGGKRRSVGTGTFLNFPEQIGPCRNDALPGIRVRWTD